MEHFEEKFKNDAEQVRLTAAEKAAVRARVLAAPLPRRSPLSFWPQIMAASFILAIIAGVPVSYAAQGSAPGDALYRFELAVLEPIEEALQFTDNARTEYHAERLEERLDEIKKSEAIVPADLATVTEDVTAHIEEISAALASTTERERKIRGLIRSKALAEAHEEVLEDLDADTEELEESVEALEEELEESKEQLTDEAAEALEAEIEELKEEYLEEGVGSHPDKPAEEEPAL